MNKKFIDEINQYDYDDLMLIYETQKDLYSIDELGIIKDKLQELQIKGQTKPLKQFPKKIKCSKCDQPNPFENDICNFCQCKLDKRKYYRDNYIYDPNEDIDDNLEMSEEDYIPKCPTCNSPNICEISLGRKIVGFGVAGVFSSNFGKTMVCNNCGYKW